MKSRRLVVFATVLAVGVVFAGCAYSLQPYRSTYHREGYINSPNGKVAWDEKETFETNDPGYGGNANVSFTYRNGRNFVGFNSGYGGYGRGGFCGYNQLGIALTCY
jgi:hypothetical protein